MGEKGWIKLFRKLKDNWVWKEHREFSKAEAWIDLLLTANHNPNCNFGIKEGEILISERTLAERWCWSRTKVHRFLGVLEKEGQIKRSEPKKSHLSNHKVNHLSICKWGTYQKQRTSQRTSQRTENSTYTRRIRSKEVVSKDTIDDILSHYQTLKDYSRLTNWGRSAKRAKQLLKEVGSVERVKEAMSWVANHLESKGLTWKLETVIEWIPEWEKSGKKSDALKKWEDKYGSKP